MCIPGCRLVRRYRFFGLARSLTVCRVSAVCRAANYAVVDLAGRYFLDPRRRHRSNVRLENLFAETYATGHGRGFPDTGVTPYLTSTLGVPRTFHVSYTLAY